MVRVSMSVATGTPDSEDFIHRGILEVVANGFFVDISSGAACALSLIQLLESHGWRGVEVEAARVPQMPVGPGGERPASLRFVASEAGSEVSADDTLSAILEKHSVTDVHLLIIDAPGTRQQALADIELARWRPWIFMICDSDGETRENEVAAWAEKLQNARYIPVYRSETHYLYIAMEQERLVKYFVVQPGTEGEPANALGTRVSSDTQTFARQTMSGEGLSRDHRSSADASAELLPTRDADLELRIARLEISQTRARLETAEAWARSSSSWVEAAEARANSAESRANAAAAWANRSDVRLREMSRQLAEATVGGGNSRSKAVQEREIEISRLHHHISGMNDRVNVLESRNHDLEQRMNAIVNSTSWRVAAPLRAAPDPLRILVRRLIRLPYRFIRRIYRRSGSPSFSTQDVTPAQSNASSPAPDAGISGTAPVTMAPVLQPVRVREYAEMFKANNKEKVAEQI